MKRLLALPLWLSLTLVLSGNTECAHTEYTIEMKPTPAGVSRRLTCKRVGSEDDALPAADRARLEQAYGPSSEDDGGCSFSKQFQSRLPADVGGAGSFQTFESRLGQTSAYMERFRGRDDPGVQVQKSLAAVDELADLLIGWASWQLSEEAGFADLRAFLDGRLRADMKNLFLLTTTLWLLQDYAEGTEEELALRAIQYLIEHGYAQPADLPAILIAFERDEAASEGSRTHTMALLRRKLADEMGRPAEEPIPATLDFLSTPDSARESLMAYLKTTRAFRRRVARNANFSPGELLDENMARIFDLALFAPEDQVAVSLHCPLPPYRTNGSWQADRKTVSWPLTAVRQPPRLPLFRYAFWSRAAEEAQTRMFGSVILTGQALAEVIVWQNGLSQKERTAFEALLDRVASAQSPNEKAELLSGFRFDPETEQDELAAFATGRILAGLAGGRAREGADGRAP